MAATQLIDAQKPPSTAEWQYFLKMPRREILQLWKYQSDRGTTHLAQWSWQWRLGWIKRCESSSLDQDFCQQIFLEGLSDAAMVVRAEAATTIGRRYEHRFSRKMTLGLKSAYLNTKNTRHDAPLFVCQRILEALANMGGTENLKLAQRLAKQNPKMLAYWSTIQSTK